MTSYGVFNIKALHLPIFTSLLILALAKCLSTNAFRLSEADFKDARCKWLNSNAFNNQKIPQQSVLRSC